MRKFVSMLLAFSMLLSFAACGKKDSDVQPATTVFDQEVLNDEISNSTEMTMEETTTKTQRLSKECDKILVSAREDDGTLYELVATQTEDYLGVVTKIGVIKNNEWLVELTTESPLIDEDGTMKGKANSIYDKFYVAYIGNGCFYYSPDIDNMYANEVFYNANNGKSFSRFEYNNPSYALCKFRRDDKSQYEKQAIVNNSGKVILCAYTRENDENNKNNPFYIDMIILDLNSMTTSKINIDSEYYYERYYPYSEGLFAAVESNGNEKDVISFFDLSGKRVLNLTEFNLSHLEQEIFFEKDICTFRIVNPNGTKYRIYINKSGEVVSSLEL